MGDNVFALARNDDLDEAMVVLLIFLAPKQGIKRRPRSGEIRR